MNLRQLEEIANIKDNEIIDEISKELTKVSASPEIIDLIQQLISASELIDLGNDTFLSFLLESYKNPLNRTIEYYELDKDSIYKELETKVTKAIKQVISNHCLECLDIGYLQVCTGNDWEVQTCDNCNYIHPKEL